VSVSDGIDESETYNLTMEVTPVNDIPVITASEGLSTPEETGKVITLSDLTVTDPDNSFPDDFTLTIGTGDNFTLDGATITPDTDFNGTLTIPVSVRDGIDESETYNLTMEVTPVNDVPVLSTTNDFSTQKGEALELLLTDFIIEDPDNSTPEDFTLLIGNGTNYTVSINQVIPEGEFVGILTVPVRVNDGIDDSNTIQISIEVNLVTGLQEDRDGLNSLSVFPNPTTDFLNISFENLIFSEVIIEISDANGKLRKSYSDFKTEAQFSKVLEHINLSSGVYLVRIIQPDFFAATRKIIIH
jgi:hypothetical protein